MSRQGGPVSVNMQESAPARRDGIKLSCISKVKIVCVSIGSQGIPARRDIAARREHVYRPIEQIIYILKVHLE